MNRILNLFLSTEMGKTARSLLGLIDEKLVQARGVHLRRQRQKVRL